MNNLLILLFLLPSLYLTGQSPETIARQHLQSQREQLGLSPSDIADLELTDSYTSTHNQVQHCFLQQKYQGIPIHNATVGMHLRNSEVLYLANRLQAQLENRINTPPVPMLSADQARGFALEHLQLAAHRVEVNEPQLCYQVLANQDIRLAWQFEIIPSGQADHWIIRVDAHNGKVIGKNNYTVHCSFDRPDSHLGHLTGHCPVETTATETLTGSYRVFPFPTESPNHGPQVLIADPADAVASPFGWHDVDGIAGAEYTQLRGNNVYVWEDRDGDQTPPPVETDGGPGLNFDFMWSADAEPEALIDAGLTNAFYASNVLHDLAFHYGFDEEAGNFQTVNYNGNPDGQDDYVRILGQYGGADPAGNNALNNANFTTQPDGSKSTMRLFLWNEGSRFLEVTEPVNVAGLYRTAIAEYGPSVANQPVSGEVVLVNDGQANSLISDGCETPFLNASALNGKIALIDRGGCTFEAKTNNAEAAGAIAVIICNYEDELLNMAGTTAPDPDIPTILLQSNDCAILRQYAGSGLVVSIQVPSDGGPSFLAADFDNGVIAHEYAHGISNRLTGGPSNTGCLTIGEQMGEGWSDFFALAITTKAGETGVEPRGIGSYLVREETTGKGIRSFPYSTDLTVNPLTYSSIIASKNEDYIYDVGAAWASMLWDMHWLLVEKYGWDPDLYQGSGGNNIALQLVMDGMKLQPCDPGFVDGRDAILQADEINYNGENQCLIWEAFARRGLGVDADQNLFYDHRDGEEDFKTPAVCQETLQIRKEVTPLIEAGADIEVTLHLANYRPDDLEGVIVSDEIASGTSYEAGSASITPVLSGSTLTFELGTLASGAELTITYTLNTAVDQYSVRTYLDDFETVQPGTWGTATIGTETSNLWKITEFYANSGDQSYTVEAIDERSQQMLQSLTPLLIEGENPVLRFFHRYNTEAGSDGGMVELSTDLGDSWQDLGPSIFRNGYDGPLDFQTFEVPGIHAFYGSSNGWKASYIDLSDFSGQEVLFRFRFATDGSIGDLGWFVDDVELLNLVHYDTEACVVAIGGAEACAQAEARGTLVDSKWPVGTQEVVSPFEQLILFPNPAEDWLQLFIELSKPATVRVRVLSMDGITHRQTSRFIFGQQTLSIPTAGLGSGFYLVEIELDGYKELRKVVIQ